MRYWINKRVGLVEGPFEEREILEMIAQGALTPMDQACPEGSEEWRKIGSIAAFAEVQVPATAGIPATLAPGYSFGNAWQVGWNLFTSRYGLVLGVSMVSVLANLVPSMCMTPIHIAAIAVAEDNDARQAMLIPQLAAACFSSGWAFLVGYPISIGAIWVLVRCARGHSDAGFNDIWTPFRHYGSVLIQALLLALCTIGAVAIGAIGGLCIGGLIGILVATLSDNPVAGIGTGVTLGYIILLVTTYYVIVRLMGSYVLVIDESAGFPDPIEAMTRSWNATAKCGWSLLGLLVVLSLIAIASFFAFCVGMFLLGIPLYAAMVAAAYFLLFPGIEGQGPGDRRDAGSNRLDSSAM